MEKLYPVLDTDWFALFIYEGVSNQDSIGGHSLADTAFGKAFGKC